MMSVHHAECLSLQKKTVVRQFVQEKPRRSFCNSILFDESEDYNINSYFMCVIIKWCKILCKSPYNVLKVAGS